MTVLGEKRLTATERDDLVALHVAYCILTDIDAGIAERSKLITNCRRDLGLIKSKITEIVAAMKDTLPEDQQRMFDNILRMSSYVVGVKGPAQSGRREDEYGSWVSWNELNALLQGCQDHCRMCTKDKYGQRKCPLRRALDVIPNDVSAESREGECPYYTEI